MILDFLVFGNNEQRFVHYKSDSAIFFLHYNIPLIKVPCSRAPNKMSYIGAPQKSPDKHFTQSDQSALYIDNRCFEFLLDDVKDWAEAQCLI